MIKRICFRKNLWIVCLLMTTSLLAQDDWRLKLNDDWFVKYGIKGLQLNESMPDIPLSDLTKNYKVINNNTGKETLFDFRGKLVILDFWNTYCADCIASFPYMEKLQSEFDGAVQVILVNPFESEEEIAERRKISKINLPNLPSIVTVRSFKNTDEFNESFLFRLFPNRGVPHHVWIDQKGVIRLIGSSMNTYSKKIKHLLDGNNVFVLKNNATVPQLGSSPYFKQLSNVESAQPIYGSFITPYNNELSGVGIRAELIDSVSGTRIVRYFNQEPVFICMQAAQKTFQSQLNRIILGKTNFIEFPEQIDTLKLSTIFYSGKLTDEDYVNSKYCYEQVVSIDMPLQVSRRYIIEDMNRFLIQRFSYSVAIEKQSVSCYVLERVSDIEKVEVELLPNNKSGFATINEVIDAAIKNNPKLSEELYGQMKVKNISCIYDNTGWDPLRRVKIKIPDHKLNSILDLRNILKQYGLDIIEKQVELDYLVFKML